MSESPTSREPRAEQRASSLFPWYDSLWLSSYVRVTRALRERDPKRLTDFVHAFDVLRTDPRFDAKLVRDVLPLSARDELRACIASLQVSEIEKHEALRFGRSVVHDAALVTRLQASLVDRMSELVGEPVEASYNFLSLYNNLGVCRVHMDAPSAKWTLDYCIEQSAPWPIYCSQVRPWPEDWRLHEGDWESAIRSDPGNHFRAFEMQEGDALVFGGSSQWHYRDRLAQRGKNLFCHLAFFHFIPRGTRELVDVDRWAAHFGLPAIADWIVKPEPVRYDILR